MQVVDTRRVGRQDTFDLREQIHPDDHSNIVQAHAEAASSHYVSTDDEEHSVLEDDSDGEERDEYMDDEDDGSSSLSIPNESIDFDLVYSLHSFAATVEGQANVVKGDSLFLMDDSNSYWWLVRVLKTQEVGYIPAENIETPFERLARLNKHRNVDLASATQAELQDGLHASQDRLRNNLNSRAGSHTPSPIPRDTRSQHTKGVAFTPALSVHRYPPAVWNEDEEEDEDVEWDDEGYEDEDQGLADEQMQRRREEEGGPAPMEPDDGMSWEDATAENMQSQLRAAQPTSNQQHGTLVQQQQQQALLQQQQQQQQQQQRGQQQAVQANQQPQTLRSVNSREGLAQGAAPLVRIDPAEATETRKVTVTPTIARDISENPSGTMLPSAVLERQQEEERIKRAREEEAEEARKKAKNKDKAAAPVNSAPVRPVAGGKLRKEQRENVEDDSAKKKKGSVFGGIFGRKKDKGNKNSSVGSVESSEITGRGSEDSGRSGPRPSVTSAEGVIPPSNPIAIQQQQQQQPQQQPQQQQLQQQLQQQQQQQQQPVQPVHARNVSDPKRAEQPYQPQVHQAPDSPHTPRSSPPQVSAHASQLRQRDQHQQALYQQYLNRSPSSPPEVSYGLQSAPALMHTGPSSYHSPTSSGSGAGLGPPGPRPRPGSLILTPSSMDGQGPGVPELSVIRVFAGKNLQTEATFKTVLLNSSTTSSDLVRQAIQRFRLPSGEDEGDYYLTVKQVEGGASAVLMPVEKPLGVFETLVVEAMELPKVKRSSVGSISSVASNLSMHPAIKKLPMNDFTDDSAVKFYLNRRSADGVDDSSSGHDADDTLIADTSHGESDIHVPRQQFLTVSTATGSGNTVTPERFTSPSFRFALQLVIYPDDLPDDMVFHPLTEAIVFKDTLRETDSAISSGVSQNWRRKVFVFPKNVTVAEVIELGLERFGIQDGVVDGGDEIEDKLTKRRSSTRVRYGLTVDIGNHEKELSPSSKVIEAFPRPPTYRAPERQSTGSKRRSVDSTMLLGTADDVNPDDPVFILRRAISYRNSTTRHRISAPLDEIELQHLHRESASSAGSDPTSIDDGKPRQPTRQDIIARQRAATRANQLAILSAQSNPVRGIDVLLPDNAMLRSSRYDSGSRMRYSYVQPDGETYDISDIVEEEWRESHPTNKNDLLEGIIGPNKGAVGEKIDRVLNKLKNGRPNLQDKDLASQSSFNSNASSLRSASPSEYSVDDGPVDHASRSRSATPGSAGLGSRFPSGPPSTHPHSEFSNPHDQKPSRPGTTTPTGKPGNKRHPSIASVISESSGYATPATQLNPGSPDPDSPRYAATPRPQQKRPIIPKDDFGLSRMLAVIECKAGCFKAPLPPLNPVDELLFGRPIDYESLHPHVREIYSDSFKQLEEMDKVLDDFMAQARVRV